MAGLGSGDGPLSVRARPSSIKRDCDRGPTSTGEKCLVNVHAKSRLTLEPLRTLRSETKGQAGACPDRTRAIPCKVRAVTAKVPMIEDHSRPALTVAKTVAMTADNACSVRTTLECWPSTETAMDGPGRCAHSYGSEGWGSNPFERASETAGQSLNLARGLVSQARSARQGTAPFFTLREYLALPGWQIEPR